MNKYIKYYNELEGKYAKLEEKYLYKLIRKFINHVPFFVNSQFASKKNIYTSFYYININLSNFSPSLKKWVKENIINAVSKDSLLVYYLMWLCSSVTCENNTHKNKLIASFNETDLIKDISYNEEKKLFILTTLDDNKIYFKNAFEKNEIDDAIKANNHCHQCTWEILKNNKDNENLYGVSVAEKNLIGGNNIHSFIVINNCLIDYAHNITMNYDDYVKLIHPKKIMYVQANRIIKNIDKLYTEDKECDNNQAQILNYALHKYMKK